MIATFAHKFTSVVEQMPNQVTAFHGWIATSS
jgi:hypothetical protein